MSCKATETCFPRSARQRCLVDRMRNLAAKVPEDQWPDFKARIQPACQASSRAIARDLAEGVVNDFEDELPSAIACFQDDFEACIAHLRLPIGHRRAIRTTNLLELLFVEERRRLTIIPNAFGEKPVLEHRRAPPSDQDHHLRATAVGCAAQATGPGLRGRNRPQKKTQPPILKPEFPAVLALDPRSRA